MGAKVNFLLGAVALLSIGTAGDDAHEIQKQFDNLEERSRSMLVATQMNNHFAAEGDIGTRIGEGPNPFILTVQRPYPAGTQLG